MAIGRRRRAPQQELFVATSDIRALDNPFYRALNGLLEEHGFDEFAEEQCREFYAGNRGRPGVPPGVYFRMLMVGLSGGTGFGAGDRVAVRRLVLAPRVSGMRADGEPAGAFDALEDAEASERGGARGGLRVRAGAADGVGTAERQDAGRGRNDAGGQRGDARDRAA